MRKIRKYRREIRVPFFFEDGLVDLLLSCGHRKRYRVSHAPKRWVYCADCYRLRPEIGPV